jgi:hypothetical protein
MEAAFTSTHLTQIAHGLILSEFAPFMISLTDFEIGKRIARGSFSELYLGLQLSTDRRARRCAHDEEAPPPSDHCLTPHNVFLDECCLPRLLDFELCAPAEPKLRPIEGRIRAVQPYAALATDVDAFRTLLWELTPAFHPPNS